MAIDFKRANRIGKILIFVLLAVLAVIVVTRYYKNRPGTMLGKPKAYELTYKPADFNLEIDEEDALAIANNPRRYRREFDRMVFDINTSVLRHVSTRMGLSDSIRAAVLEEYERNHHGYLSELYFNDLLKIRDTTSQIYETWYDNESGSATAALEEITSKYTCFLINQVLVTVIPTREGQVLAKGEGLETPCGIAMTEALRPLLKKMEERAAIEDFSRSRGLLQEKVERAIAELATMEVRDKKGINKQMQTKIWGVNVSSSDLEITAISILKVGFRLNDRFEVDLNPRSNIVTITLPEPEILSHEVYPKIEKLDIGWLREVESVNFNESFNALRKEFRREANESQIFSQSKRQVVSLMNTMFGPIVKSINNRYEVKVRFERVSGDAEGGELLGGL